MMPYPDPTTDPQQTPPMQLPLAAMGGTEDLENRAEMSRPGSVEDLESRRGPRMNPMLAAEHGIAEPSPQGPPPTGKEQFHNTMADFSHRAEANRAAVLGLDPEDPDYTKKLGALQAQHGAITTEKARYQMLHPWGGPESAHPGVLGKIGHVAGEIGNTLGGNTLQVPGSQGALQAAERSGAAETETGIGDQQKAATAADTEAQVPERKANTAHLEQETADAKNKPATPESMQQEYTDAVTDAQNRGVDPATDPKVVQLQDAITATQKEPAEKMPPHITTQGPDGKSHIMERDPKTGQYSIDRGVAPPNYAQVLPQVLGTKTTEMLGPDGIQHRYQYNDQTGKYDIDMGAAPTGASAHQIFQASAIENLAPQIISDIQANRAILGNLDSYYKQWTTGTPVADPKAAQLMTELMSFAAMQPALHAFRSTNAMEAFEKMVGGLAKDPDAIIASINGLLKTPQAFTGMAHKGDGNTGRTPPAGATHIGTSNVDGKKYYLDAQGRKLGPA